MSSQLYEHRYTIVGASNGEETIWYSAIMECGFAPYVWPMPLLRDGETLRYDIFDRTPPSRPPAEFAESCHG